MTASPDYQYLAPYLALASAAVWAGMLLVFLASNRREIRSGMVKLGSWYFIIPCLALAVLAIAAAAYGFGIRSNSVSPTSSLNSARTANLSDQPNYVGSLRFVGGLGDKAVTHLEFKATNYLDRLRIYVEFASSQSRVLDDTVWGPKHKILIADLRDVTKDQAKTVPLIYESHSSGQDAAFWWGDPSVKLENSDPLLQRAKNKARIYFVGPDNREQSFKIIAIKSAYDVSGVTMYGTPLIMIMDEREVKSALDWSEE